jgi:hypothetical protein
LSNFRSKDFLLVLKKKNIWGTPFFWGPPPRAGRKARKSKLTHGSPLTFTWKNTFFYLLKRVMQEEERQVPEQQSYGIVEEHVFRKNQKKKFLAWSLDRAINAMNFLEDLIEGEGSQSKSSIRKSRRDKKKELLPILEKQWLEMLGDKEELVVRVCKPQETPQTASEVPPLGVCVVGRNQRDEIELGRFRLDRMMPLDLNEEEKLKMMSDFYSSALFFDRLKVVAPVSKCALCCQLVSPPNVPCLGRRTLREEWPQAEGPPKDEEEDFVWLYCDDCVHKMPIFAKDKRRPGFEKHMEAVEMLKPNLEWVEWEGGEMNILLPNCGWIYKHPITYGQEGEAVQEPARLTSTLLPNEEALPPPLLEANETEKEILPAESEQNQTAQDDNSLLLDVSSLPEAVQAGNSTSTQ